MNVSVTRSSTPTVVSPAAKNHSPLWIAQASSAFTTSSTLDGSKNQK